MARGGKQGLPNIERISRGSPKGYCEELLLLAGGTQGATDCDGYRLRATGYDDYW
ncbi:hypothetical protein PVK06_009513 [Gossypium arboreum]|uniref:Uncharacterized protein n=1 Tax=Gossypium arboreum TaxID=29729 RepID=A0ABR0QMP2_GOSAR|nr:hypothetical protein PVK06_009513 [Gossypium arboreum]